MTQQSKKLTPNIRELIAHKMSVDAFPAGGGFGSAVDYLISPDLGKRAAAAAEWVKQAIQAVKSAPDNPYGDDDDAIAGGILKRIEERIEERKKR